MNILVLGGTGEARALAGQLVEAGHRVITSLAGRTSDPILPPGDLRVGKFGGVAGLAAYLKAARIDRLVDATHPYAGLISINAVAASRQTGIPLVRYMRPAWEPETRWQQVADTQEAAGALPVQAEVLLTTGHAGLEHFAARGDCDFLVRLIEPPNTPLPDNMRLLLARPPFDMAGETVLMGQEAITHLVTKNSGGEQTRAKLDAAAVMGVAVIMIERPAYGPAREVGTLDEAVAAVHDAS